MAIVISSAKFGEVIINDNELKGVDRYCSGYGGVTFGEFEDPSHRGTVVAAVRREGKDLGRSTYYRVPPAPELFFGNHSTLHPPLYTLRCPFSFLSASRDRPPSATRLQRNCRGVCSSTQILRVHPGSIAINHRQSQSIAVNRSHSQDQSPPASPNGFLDHYTSGREFPAVSCIAFVATWYLQDFLFLISKGPAA